MIACPIIAVAIPRMSLREILFESRVAEQESRIGKRLIDKIREQEHEERYMF